MTEESANKVKLLEEAIQEQVKLVNNKTSCFLKGQNVFLIELHSLRTELIKAKDLPNPSKEDE